MDAIDAAWTTLLDLGAVESDDHASPLTALGRHVRCIDLCVSIALTEDEHDPRGSATGEDACSGHNLQVP